MKRIYACSLVATLMLCTAGCQRKPTVAGSLEVQPHTITLAYPQLTTVRLTWTPSATTSEGDTPSEPLVFLHLLGAKGQVLRTFDHRFPQHWAAGTPVTYEVKLYQSALAPPLDPGKYRLGAGLYDQSGKRWALDGLGESIGRLEYVAADVEVPSAQAAGPRFDFSPTWLPLEAGSDKQVVARRWLADQPGEIDVSALPGPGSIWLSFRIPPGDGANEKLVLHDQATNSPAVVVRSTCGSVETGISGPGRHDIDLPVDAPGAASCKITLAPNFHILATEGPPRRSVSLEVVAWTAAGAGSHGNSAPAGTTSSGAPATSEAPPTAAPSTPPAGSPPPPAHTP